MRDGLPNFEADPHSALVMCASPEVSTQYSEKEDCREQVTISKD